MNGILERIQQAHRQAMDQVSEHKRAIEDTELEARRLAYSILIPKDEAVSEFRRELEHHAARGEYRVRRYVKHLASARGTVFNEIDHYVGSQSRPRISELLPDDPKDLIAYLFRNQLEAAVEAELDALHEEGEIGPPREERKALLADLHKRRQQLHADLEAAEEALAQFASTNQHVRAGQDRLDRAERKRQQREHVAAVNQRHGTDSEAEVGSTRLAVEFRTPRAG